MNRRERWYRLAMRAYPREYRHNREDEFIATLLEADSNARRPSIGELTALLANGLGNRAARLPDGRAGLRVAGAVAASLVIVAVVASVTYTALLFGYTPDNALGVVLGLVVTASTVLALFSIGSGRRLLLLPIGVVVAALFGGPGLIGLKRAFLLALAGLAVVVTTCPPVRRSTAAVCAIAATIVGVVIAIWMPGGLPEMLPGWALFNPQGVRETPDPTYSGFDSGAVHIAVAVLVGVAIAASLAWSRRAWRGRALPSLSRSSPSRCVSRRNSSP